MIFNHKYHKKLFQLVTFRRNKNQLLMLMAKFYEKCHLLELTFIFKLILFYSRELKIKHLNFKGQFIKFYRVINILIHYIFVFILKPFRI